MPGSTPGIRSVAEVQGTPPAARRDCQERLASTVQGNLSLFRVTDDGAVYEEKEEVAAYVGSVGPLPQDSRRPATEKEVEAYCRLQEAVWQLVSSNMGLAKRQAVMMGLSDEVVDTVGADALLRAAVRWKPERSAFSTFATNTIRYAYLDHIESCQRIQIKESEYEYRRLKRWNDQDSKLAKLEEVQCIIGQLSQEDQELLMRTCLLEETLKQSGERLGLTKAGVWQRLKKIRARCHAIVKGDEDNGRASNT